MAAPLVATKLYAPRLRPGSVRRPRLSGRLAPREETRLVLVSAPAGFGKSTLLAEWLAEATAVGRRIAFLSLDHTDADPRAFWSHVVAALQRGAGVGETMAAALEAGDPPDEDLLAILLNILAGVPGGVDIVLDDYHVIDRAEIHAGLAFLLEGLPEGSRLVISTRADPPLQLPRLRARGELVEVRAADLRFDPAEAADYLNGTMGLRLTAGNVADLDDRTEGWIAALQLAALTLRGRADADDFIATFTGNDRYVFDYLVEEVLQRQPPELRRFLLRTSILDRLGGPVCDAVLGTSGSAAVLDGLHRGNLFLMPLDDRRQWYRYHHLFAEVLQAHLREEAPGDVTELHRRAAAFFETQGETESAIRHALAGSEFDRAAALIARSIPELRRSRQEALLRDWLKALPDAVVRANPVLGVGLVGALLSNGEFDGIDGRLADAERALAQVTAHGVASDAQLDEVPTQIWMYRAAMAQVRGDMPAMMAAATRAAEGSAPGDHLGRAAAAGLLGIACWTGGDLERAAASWNDCFLGLAATGHVSDALGSSVALAEIAVTRGRLGEAFRAIERALRLAATRPGLAPRGTADLHATLAGLHRERGDFAAAREHLATSRQLGDRAGLGPYRCRLGVAMAGVAEGEGDLATALDLLVDAERAYVGDFFPNVRPVAAMAARLRIAAGRLDEAARWRRESGVGIEDETASLREYEHLTLARLLLAEQRAARSGRGSAELVEFLGRLERAAERGGRGGSLIDIALLKALAHGLRNESGAAMASLERALALAEPEGFVRLFADLGAPMAELLGNALRRGVAPAYVRELLAAFAPVRTAARPETGEQPAEPLSERELDVLRLLRTELDGPAIARELEVSLNTMRTHTKKIFEKLGVNNRRSAVRRAEELNLLQRRPR
ncbi:MAG: hypothetical protein KIT43_09210 [Bauldia sp.]|nr:hypothetical protein [Bauldia sp.]